MSDYDVLIIGAGAAGMMAAAVAGRRGRRVVVVDHAEVPGEKIRISGGGRCNFTNSRTKASHFLSANPHFCKSALSRYTPRDFIGLVDRYGIAWHEKKLGQLFCDGSATQIVDLLRREMAIAGAELRLSTRVEKVERSGDGFRVDLGGELVTCRSLIVATGGKSIPKMGASGFGYDLALQFGLKIIPTRPALVPLTFDQTKIDLFKELSGISVDGRVGHGKQSFDEAILFTHRGLSGPAILQISSYWREGDEITVCLAPETKPLDLLKAARAANGRQSLQTALATFLPKRLAQMVAEESGLAGNMADFSDKTLAKVEAQVNQWQVKPVGSEGYRTAEVTLGGVDTNDLESKTMEARQQPGLYFIGEVVDVTGWLGGYNFQWAWSSAVAAGQVA